MYRRLALTLTLTLAAPPAAANPWDFYGFNARGVGLGNALTAGADDFTAAYYNPGSLGYVADPGFGFGYTLSRPDLGLEFEGQPTIGSAEVSGSDGVTFGAVYPMTGRDRPYRLTLGLGLNVPTGSLLVGEALDPSVPQWLLYGSLPRRIVSVLSVGVKPVSWISVGAGIQILAGVTGQLEYELDPVAGRFVEKSVRFDIAPNAAALVGVDLRPIEEFRIGFTYRGAISTDVDLPLDLTLTGISDLEVLTFFQIQYTPPQFSLGLSYDHTPWGLRAFADLTLARWSEAPDPSVQSSLDLGGALLEGTGLADAFDAPAPGQARTVDLGFRDVWVPRFGVEKDFGPASIRVGYALRPSPAPQQTGSTNYIDGTAHVVSAGAGIVFRDPWGILAGPLTVDMGGAVSVFPRRRHGKTASDDPVGSFSASGQIWVGAVTVGYRFADPQAAEPSAKAGARE